MKSIHRMFTPSNSRRGAIRAALLGLALSCVAMPIVAADSFPPRAMTYQGYITDSGTPLGNINPANYDIVFRIYDTSSVGTGNLKWAEKQTVTIDKGQFSVVLGEGAANGSDPHDPLNTVFSSDTASDRFIDITVKINNTDVNIAPRLRLVTSPYAFLAKSASTIIGADGGTLMTSAAPNSLTVAGTLNATLFNGNGSGLTDLTAGQIPNLDAGKIASGTLNDSRLSGNVPLKSGGKIADSVLPTTQSGKTFNSAMGLTGTSTFEFGVGEPKQGDNGKIGYKTFTSGLDIVGAGFNVSDRRITFHAQGGSSFSGTVGVNGGSTDIPLTVWGYSNRGWGNSPDGFANNSGFNGCCGLGSAGGGVFPTGIWAEQWIVGAGIVANSDRRIKDLVGLSDTRHDLETIQKLRVTDYRMVDKLRQGDGLHKGFIAQEVASIVPEAVGTRQNNVPDIYTRAAAYEYNTNSHILKVTLPKAHGLAKGDTVVVFPDDVSVPQELLVTAAPSIIQFEAECKVAPKEQLFVYGHRVDDFKTVNYDHIFTIGIGAIQELNKELQAKDARIAALEEKASKVQTLEKEIAALKKQASATQEASQRADARFQALESALKKLAIAQPAAQGVVVADNTAR